MELISTVTNKREDLRTNHKEANNILAHQMVVVASEESKGVSVISDDTEAYWNHLLKIVTIGIKATAIEHRNIIPDLLAAHALSGCDTTACYFGIGKGTIV